MSTILNAAPMTKFLGVDDKSTRPLVPEPEDLPTHLPMVYGFAKKGPTDPQLVVGASRSLMYGDESFDLRSKFATHQTVLSNTVNSQGNSQMFQRLKPVDAGPNASIRYYLDVLETQVPEYARNSDGSYQLDNDGLPVETGNTINGIRAKWVVEAIPVDADGLLEFGQGTQKPGDQTDGVNQSLMYPMFEQQAPYFGGDGNNYGTRVWAPTLVSNSVIDQRIIANEKVYPFRIAYVYRKDDLTTPSIVENMTAGQWVDVCFKPNTIDRNTDAQLYIGDVLIQSYQDLESTINPPLYGPFGSLHVYNANIEEVLQKVYDNEKLYVDEFSDITGVEDDETYRLNLIGGVTSSNTPYHSFILSTSGGNAVRLSEGATAWAMGGSDGTMNETTFAALVAQEVSNFANPNSILQDSARYPVSIIYDSGYPLTTKKALCSFIAVRKDTFVVLSTHDVNGMILNASQETSLAIALRTQLQAYPESEYFGTSVMRGMVIGRCGKLLNSQYTKKLPLTIEIARKSASYMGASNGIWKEGFAFDAAPGSQVQMFADINVTFTPAAARNRDWEIGLNWVQSFQRRSYFFPALKTVYDKDTSVLNSYFTAMCCVELQKVGERAWRQFSGSANLTNEQLRERVNQFVVDNTKGRFDGRFVIEPDTYFTAADIARGYSWTLKIKLWAPNMKTVEVLSIEARRRDELEDQTAT